MMTIRSLSRSNSHLICVTWKRGVIAENSQWTNTSVKIKKKPRSIVRKVTVVHNERVSFPRTASLRSLHVGRNPESTYFSSFEYVRQLRTFTFSRFPGAFPRICISLPVRAREKEEDRESIKLFRSFTDVRRFSRAISSPLHPARAYFFTLYFAALNGQICLSHLNARYRLRDHVLSRARRLQKWGEP